MSEEPKEEADHIDPLPGREEFEFMDDPAQGQDCRVQDSDYQP